VASNAKLVTSRGRPASVLAALLVEIAVLLAVVEVAVTKVRVCVDAEPTILSVNGLKPRATACHVRTYQMRLGSCEV